MMALFISVFAVGALHALAPDHWLPFVMISKAEAWSHRRLAWWVFLAGLAHVTAAFLIGLGGIFLGITFNQITHLENIRGGLFSFMLIGFGLTYVIWALKQTRPDRFVTKDQSRSLAGRLLLAFMVLGPCEPLIPFLFLGSFHGWIKMTALFFVFLSATVGTMLVTTQCIAGGLSLRRVPWMERFSHVFAGLGIAATGIFVRFLGS
ncbi:MAG: hypothetical protein AUJ71_03345 [Candidatus Omnitrophica bacterium CG1_02_49_16]|nr:MAG: hypothetical protein AUJ71_03345 [Candidatus Omnitrophica bacterium CG1_02_49_16]